MKRSIALLLMSLVVVSLCACGGKSSSEESPSNSNSSVVESIPEIEAEPIAEPTIEPMPEPVGQFDYTQMSRRDEYQYDEFDKRWVFFSTYLYRHENLFLGLSIQLNGEPSGSNLSEAYLVLKLFTVDKVLLGTMKSLEILIDGTVYSYETLPEATQEATAVLVLYQDGYKLIKAIATTEKPVSVRITDYNGYKVTMELNNQEFQSSIQKLCKSILYFDIWPYYIPNDNLASYERQYPLTIRQ